MTDFDGICHNFIHLSSIPQQDSAVAALPGGLPPLLHPYAGSTSCTATTDLPGKNWQVPCSLASGETPTIHPPNIHRGHHFVLAAILWKGVTILRQGADILLNIILLYVPLADSHFLTVSYPHVLRQPCGWLPLPFNQEVLRYKNTYIYILDTNTQIYIKKYTNMYKYIFSSSIHRYVLLYINI